MEKGRSRLVGRVGSEFLLIAEGDDGDRLGTGHLTAEGLPEETADHFEVPHQVAPAVFAGGGKELEVSRLNVQPRVVGSGGGGGKGDEQEGGKFGTPLHQCTLVLREHRSLTVAARIAHHDEECSTGSVEPCSMRATSACSCPVRSMRPASFRPRVSMGRPMRTVTRPLRM